ncbi:hypothetical protein [Dactylosporangium sp. CA-092794]|uniref:hypothetical protein n=1 Tax=Dactylosporangium sp. CA-092794 TaxID=3239929 RepID=UPI003D8B7CB0
MVYPGSPPPHQPYPPQHPAYQQPPQYPRPPVPPGYPTPLPAGYPQPYGVPAPPSPALLPSVRIDVVQGTPFGVAYPAVQGTTSGPAIGSLVAGIASILVALFAGCLGLTGAKDGWGLAAGGAFTVLGAFLGAGAIGLGVYGNRQVRRASADRVISGRGLAVTGIVLGSVGVGLALLAILGTLLLSV